MTTVLAALVALGALISASVLLIANRASIAEFFGKEDRLPSPRWYAWMRTVLLIGLGFWYGARLSPESCRVEFPENPAIEEQEPTENSDVG